MKKREIGVHFRLTDTLQDLAEQARRLDITIFQCFLIRQSTERYIAPSKKEIDDFLALRQHFSNLYLHGSYWINIAHGTQGSVRTLVRELALAERLDFSYFILHPGTTKGHEDRLSGIDTIATIFNQLLKTDRKIQLVLENTAYAGMSVGSALHDFSLLRLKLEQPEKVKFCIDTAHAHAFGYDVVTPEGQEEFVTLLDMTVGIDNIVLLHVNDTKERRGSFIDRHDVLGTGLIGKQALKRLVNHPRLMHIPLLLELPVMPEAELKQIIDEVKMW